MRCLLFGICLVASQAGILRCQRPVLGLPEAAAGPRDRIRSLIEDPSGAGFQEAIRLVRELGPCAAALAWDLQEPYRGHATRRLRALVLAAVAEADTASMLRGVQRASVDERVLACLVSAAMEREGPADVLEVVAGMDRPLPLRLAVAALAVAPRGAVATRVAEGQRDDPGVVAAAMLSGAALDCDLRAWLGEDTRRRPHADLVRRGVFLGQIGSGTDLPEQVLRAARRALEATDNPEDVREAAALLLGSRGRLQAEGPRPLPPMLWQFAAAADPDHMAWLRGWLDWQPSPLDEHPGRLAVCHAFSHGVADLLASRSEWSSVPEVADDLALALALRLLRVEQVGEAVPAHAGDVGLGRPSLTWVDWAAGQRPGPSAASGDNRLDAAARLAAEGRLPRVAAARVLEDALWLRGSHPRLAVRLARLRLVRDLLLSGSNAGARYLPLKPLHERYAPRDLPRDAQWFEVALPAWDELSPPALPMPERHRLR